MKKAILILMVFFLSNFLDVSYSSALEDTVNVNALVPSEEITPGPGSGGAGAVPIISDTVPPIISNIKINSITLNSAKVSWDTSELAVPQINYGKTVNFNKTFIGESFSNENAIFLENLSSETLYYLEIIAIDRGGNRSLAGHLNFKTLSVPVKIYPDNVSYFIAKAGDAEIFLSWQNPVADNFQAVKIFRSEIFYPKNSGEGALVYDGGGNSFTDKNLTNGIIYYYSAFVYDKNGDYSSGAVVKAMPQKIGLLTPTPTPLTPGTSLLPTATPQISPIPGTDNLKLEDFNFTQDGNSLKIIDGKIEVESGKSLVVSIDSKKVPEAAGTMMFILAQDGEPQSFLFKNDSEKNEHSVSFAPPVSGGVYSLTIALLDKENNPVQAISGNLIVHVAAKTPEQNSWYVDLLWIFLIVFIILVLRAIWKLIRKMREENKRKKEQNKK